MDQSSSRLISGGVRLRQRRWLALAVTLGIFLIALALRFAAATFLPTPYPFLVFLPAIGLATFVGGFRTGVLFAMLATAAGAFFLALPGAPPSNYVGLAYFAAVALAVCYVIGLFNQALEQNLTLVVQLRAAIDRAEAATATRTRMMARIGHDLKLPLQTIVGTLDLLSARRQDNTDRADIDRAQRAVAQQLRALDNLLEAARLELGQRAPAPRRFAITDALTALGEDCAPLAERKGLRFRTVASSAIVATDHDMLMTILRNLAANAVKYTPRGGGVVVGVRRRGDALRIDVVDNGVGIASDKLSRIFDEFFQETQHSDGVGLGLAIVKEASNLLNCRIEADSQPGRGTRFSIFVPRVAAVVDATHAAVDRNQAPVRSQ
jgi:signal transduction histidine kinase